MSAKETKSVNKRTKFSLKIKDLIGDFIYKIDLDADYQREKVWSTEDQELLLDSIISNIDIPKIYLAKLDSENEQFDYECVDGKQRLITLLNFFAPDQKDPIKKPLTVSILNEKFTYKQLQKEYPEIVQKIENYDLDFVSYEKAAFDKNDDFLRLIFKRLQLGIRLNSGELLHALQGTLRDFIFKKNGEKTPFLRNTNLSSKRFSRQFTLAQICLNSFKKKETNEFVRARLLDMEDFILDNAKLDSHDENLIRIEKVLEVMDNYFGSRAIKISSRAVAVSAYLFSEELVLNKKESEVEQFSEFFIKLLEEMKRNTTSVNQYEKPKNQDLMDNFQKFILQASVESSSIRRRHEFLKKSFEYYTNPKTKGNILGSKN